VIVVRYTWAPTDDWQKIRDLLVEWRDAHPEDHWRICGSVTGRQRVMVLEAVFQNDDITGIANSLFEAGKHWTPEMKAWGQRFQGVDAVVETRELWRLVE
jgi:hypothetical protein